MSAFRGAAIAATIGLLMWVLIVSGAVLATKASADPLCEARGSAHIEKHGGLAKDSAEHIARGELPTCDPNPDKGSQESDNHDDDRKSRHCRRHWYC